jgi:hypothetical protein
VSFVENGFPFYAALRLGIRHSWNVITPL